MDSEALSQLLADIVQCNAAYITDDGAARAEFTKLGYSVIDRYSDDNAQAVLVNKPKGAELIFSGTRISEGTFAEHIGDLFRDIDAMPLDLGGGLEVAAEPYQGCRKVYQWALSKVPSWFQLDFKGHSLGGWQTTYAPLYVPNERIGRIVAFASPKQGNEVFWSYFQELFDQVFSSVVLGQDPWFGYPPTELTTLSHGGRKHIWLDEGKVKEVTEADWIGGDLLFHAFDHGPTSLIEALTALVAEAKPSTGDA